MNDTEWAIETDWTKAHLGDTVRLTNADGADVTVYIIDRRDPYYSGDRWISSQHVKYSQADWTLHVEATPKPVLPTEQGAYRDAVGNYWNLSGAGVWYGFYGGRKSILENPPLRRLEPVSETAKKVLDRVRIILHLGRPFVMRSLDDIGEEFGVEL